MESEPPATPASPAAHPPRTRLRWGAIAIGAATDIGSTQLCGTLVMMSIGFRMPMSASSPADLAAAQAAIQSVMATPSVFVFMSMVGLMCSAAGGYLTAYLAKTRVLRHATVMGICSAIAGVLMLSASGRSALGFTELALTAATIPAAVLGGMLAGLLCGRSDPQARRKDR